MSHFIKQDQFTKIQIQRDIVIKTFNKPKLYITKDWIYHYNNYNKIYNTTVKILEADHNKIIMQYVKGTQLVQLYHEDKLSHKQRYQSYQAAQQNLANMCEYSSMIGQSFFHNDCGAHNIIKQDNDYILIDPDSFMLNKNPYAACFLSPLQNILYSMKKNEV